MWSIVMEPGKIYSTVVENTFHLSMATLDLESVQKGKADDVHTVYVETDDNSRVILCHLSKESKLYQCQLDHIFPRGTDLKFVTSATANIHMTGNLYLNEDNELYSDLESESEEEGTQIEKSVQEKGNKRKSEDNVSKKNKSIKLDESNQSDEDSVDENDSDEIMDFEEDSNEDGIKLSDLVSDDDEDEDIPVLTIKTEELQNTPIKQLNGYDQKSPKQEQKTPLGQEKTPKCQKTPMPKTPDANQTLINGTTKSSKNKKNKEPKTPLSGLKTEPDSPLPKDKQNQQQKLNGAVIINDLKVGDGAVEKPGKNVHNNIVQKRCTILSPQQAEETDKLLNELSIDSDCTSNDDDDDVDDDEEKDNDYVDVEDIDDDDKYKLSDLVSDDDKDEEDDDDDEDEDLPVLTIKTEELQNTPIKQLNGYDQKSPKQEQKTPLGQEKTPNCQKTPMPKTPDANQTLINGTTKSSKNKKNKEPKTPLSGLKTEPDSPLPKDKQNQQQKLNGAVIINDLKVGDGAVAKPGKNVHNNIVQKRCTILSPQQAEETDKLLNELSIDSDCTSNDDDDDVDDDEEKDNDYVDVEDIDDDDKYKLKPDRKQNSYECSACCLKYKYKSQYLRHMMKHSKQKLFKCSFSEKCNKVFKTNQNMLRHVAQQHASIERYECSKCNSVYRHKSSLTSHMQDKHSHRKIQHVCNVCQKSFSKFQILKYHLNDHSGEKPYKCEFCDERFSEPSKKCRHVKKMHRA